MAAPGDRDWVAGISPAKQELLLRLLQRKKKHEAPPPLTPRAPGSGPIPLSFAQQRLWFLDQLEPDSPFYNVPVAVRLSGPLSAEALDRSLREIVRRHEALRTVFPVRAGEPEQAICPPPETGLTRLDLTSLLPGAREAEVQRLAAAEAQQPFNLVRGPLFRFALLKLAAAEHVLLLTFHHIVYDGWSLGVLIRELGALYQAFQAQRPSPLAELPIQYADHAVWQRQWLSGDVLAAQLGHWKQKLAGAPPALDLPSDRPRPPLLSHRGALMPVALPAELSQAILGLGRREGVTLFMTLLAAFALLLQRHTGRDDVIVGSPIAGRSRPETEDLIGFFANTLVLRADLSGQPSFRELLGRVRESTLAAYAHQDVPFEKLVEELAPERDPGRSPLFQVMLALQNAPLGALALGDLTLHPVEVAHTAAKFDLTLSLGETPEGISGGIEYSTDLFDGATVARLFARFQTLLAAAVADPGRRLADLPLLPAAERHELATWNDTAAAYPHDRAAHALFEARAEQTPDAPALRFAGSVQSYRELNRQANRLAHLLRERGVGPEVKVALCAERSPEMVTAMLAILKAGGAFVPLDPSYPDTRLAFLLEDSGATLLLTQAHLAERLGPHLPNLLLLDAEAAEISRRSAADLVSPGGPGHLAYVIYTSGSTGRPKGVLIEHRGLCNLVQAQARAFAVTPGTRVLQFARIGFDACVSEIFVTLCAGATLCLAPSEDLLPGAPLADVLRREAIEVVTLPPSALAVLPQGPYPALTTLIAAGEACPADHPERWATERRFLNAYGPTEITVCATIHPCPPGASRRPPIGHPIANTQAHLLDRHGQPVPTGVTGELHLGGAGIARGYLGRPGLTAARFLPDPFSDTPGARLYRTGDLCRRLSDGALEFVGRDDDQIKLRGFRIEPGEIESALAAAPGVREVVVVARPDVHGEPHLVAYVTAREATLSLPELRRHLLGQLPDYMVPARIVTLAALPLTPHGKIDRRALPAPDLARVDAAAPVPPRTPVEHQIAELWTELLGISQVGTTDDFFLLGGHSLLATRLVSRIRDHLGVELPLRAVFAAPTVAGLAARVEQARAQAPARLLPAIPSLPRDRPLALSFAQERLWFLDQLDPGSAAYSVPVALRLRGALSVEALRQAIEEVVRRHEPLRTTFAARAGEPPFQIIQAPTRWSLPLVDLTSLPAAEREREALRIAEREALSPFDLHSGPVLRTLLVRLATDEHVAMLAMHHIAADGWSAAVLLRELGILYAAALGGSPSPLPDLPVHYADYAAWQRQWLSGDHLDAELAHWSARMAGAPVLELPFDRPRPALQSQRGGLAAVSLSPDLTAALRQLAQAEGATLFMTLLAAFFVLLHRHGGQDDICVGVPIAGRRRAELEPLIGFFVNTLVLRADLTHDPPFLAFLARVRLETLDALGHQDLPFERLVEAQKLPRDLGRTPLFQAMFSLETAPAAAETFPGLVVEALPPSPGVAKFDLSLSLTDQAGRLEGAIEYSTDLFDAATAERLARRFERLAAAIAATPDHRLAALDLLTAEDRAAIHLPCLDSGPGFPPGACLHQLVEAQVDRTPDAVAVLAEGQAISYRELDAQANRIAHHLHACGAGPGSRVGLCLPRSPAAVAALLGILKTGAAFVPLDPESPPERLRAVVAESALVLLLTDADQAAALPQRADLPLVDICSEGVARAPATRLHGQVTPAHVAYVLTTSGSTGRPKGVMVPHSAVINHTAHVVGFWGLCESDRVLQYSSLAFDASSEEIWPALCIGATLVVASDEARLSPRAFTTFCTAHGVTASGIPTAFFRVWTEDLVDHLLPSRLRLCAIGGEAAPADGVARWLAWARGQIRLLNTYGPTEATIVALATDLDSRLEQGVPLGRPIRGTSAHVLGPGGAEVPPGASGELLLGGAGLAHGYLGRPALTAERFVPSPFGHGERLYRTGDRVRRLGSGDLVFVRRADEQIKIRGFRVEPGDVEAALRTHPAVRDAAVVARGDALGERHLAAFVIAAASDAADLAPELRRHLGEKLPAYMLPAAFAQLATFPRTAGGKVDRAALRQLVVTKLATPGAAPLARTAVEQAVSRIYAAVLDTPEVGLHDSFFALGGHSLLATRVISQIRAELEIDLPLRALFEAPTVAALAARIEAARRGATSPGDQDKGLAAGPAADHPLYLVPGAGGSVLDHADLARYLDPAHPLVVLDPAGTSEPPPRPLTVQEMAREHLAAIRARQPQGPYHLGGWSFGGVVAFEMARQLHAAGEPGPTLTFLDSHAPPAEIAAPADELATLAELAALLGLPWRDLPIDPDHLRALPPAARVAHLLDVARRFLSEPPRFEAAQIARWLAVYQRDVEALRLYQPEPYPGSAVLFRAEIALDGDPLPADLGWSPLLGGGLRVVPTPGDHRTMLRPPHVEGLAAALSRRLRDADASDADTMAAAPSSLPPKAPAP